jgi:hypothetical protein
MLFEKVGEKYILEVKSKMVLTENYIQRMKEKLNMI